MKVNEAFSEKYGDIEELEDVLGISKLKPYPSVPDLRYIQSNVKSIEKALKYARQMAAYSDDKDVESSLDDLGSDLDVIISDLDDMVKLVDELDKYSTTAVDIIEEWKSFAKDRMTEDEHQEWKITQVRNKLIKANSR